MHKIAAQELKSHLGKLVQVTSGRTVYVGTLTGRGARIAAAGSGWADSTWILRTRSSDVEFHPGDCDIYSLQYLPVGVAS